jgi:hypothetical protein
MLFFGTDDTDFTDPFLGWKNQSALIFPAGEPPLAEVVRRIRGTGFFEGRSPCNARVWRSETRGKAIFGTDDTDFTDEGLGWGSQRALTFPALDPPAAERGIGRIGSRGFIKQKSRRRCDSGSKARVRGFFWHGWRGFHGWDAEEAKALWLPRHSICLRQKRVPEGPCCWENRV